MKPLLSDELWLRLEPLLPRPKPRRFRYPGRKPLAPRKVLTGILFILKTGISWEDLPAEMGCGCGKTCKTYLRRWYRRGLWQRLQVVLLAELDEAHLIDWERAAVDSASCKAPCGGRATGPNPTDRRKLGTKHHIVVDGTGIPLAVTTTKANCADCTQLIPLLNALPEIPRKRGNKHRYPKRMYGDRAYDDQKLRRACWARGIEPFLPKKRTKHGSGLGKIRWVVERTLSWLHQFRRVGYRRDRSLTFHRAFVLLAMCVIALRHLIL
jgi:transposase